MSENINDVKYRFLGGTGNLNDIMLAVLLAAEENTNITWDNDTGLLQLTGNMQFSDGADRSIIGPTDANLIVSTGQDIHLSTDNGTTIVVNIADGGNVGIGIGATAPSEKLHVAGSTDEKRPALYLWQYQHHFGSAVRDDRRRRPGIRHDQRVRRKAGAVLPPALLCRRRCFRQQGARQPSRL